MGSCDFLASRFDLFVLFGLLVSCNSDGIESDELVVMVILYSPALIFPE